MKRGSQDVIAQEGSKTRRNARLKKSALGANADNAVAPRTASILGLPFLASGRGNGIPMAHIGPPYAGGKRLCANTSSAAISAAVGLDYQ